MRATEAMSQFAHSVSGSKPIAPNVVHAPELLGAACRIGVGRSTREGHHARDNGTAGVAEKSSRREGGGASGESQRRGQALLAELLGIEAGLSRRGVGLLIPSMGGQQRRWRFRCDLHRHRPCHGRGPCAADADCARRPARSARHRRPAGPRPSSAQLRPRRADRPRLVLTQNHNASVMRGIQRIGSFLRAYDANDMSRLATS